MYLSGGANKPTIERLDSSWTAGAGGQRKLLETIAELDPDSELWRRDGHRGLPEWLAARLGISVWAARRWIHAAHALTDLPLTSAALESGQLSLDKVIELCRFATPQIEPRLIAWAQRATVWGIRRRAEVATRPHLDDVTTADNDR
jgi:hypothetical protein